MSTFLHLYRPPPAQIVNGRLHFFPASSYPTRFLSLRVYRLWREMHVSVKLKLDLPLSSGNLVGLHEFGHIRFPDAVFLPNCCLPRPCLHFSDRIPYLPTNTPALAFTTLAFFADHLNFATCGILCKAKNKRATC